MHKMPYVLNSIISQLFSEHIYRVLALIAAIIMLLINSSALAAVECPVGYISDNFDSKDYTSLAPVVSPPNPKIDQDIVGVKSESYLIVSNSLILDGSLTTTAGSSNTYQSVVSGGTQVFEFFQDFSTVLSTRTVSYTFKNNFTKQPQPLSNVSLSIFDIDTNIAGYDGANRRYFEFFDQATITGFTSTDIPVTPVLKFRGTGISESAPYRQMNTTSNVACSGLDNDCKVSVAFDRPSDPPIVRVEVTYGNNPNLKYYDRRVDRLDDPGDQLIYIKFDGYCYQPQPRLTYSKVLSTSRKTNTDQFTVQIKDNADSSVVTNGITSTTTRGSGNTVTTGTGTTGTFKVNPTKTYTLTEAIAGTTNLADYAASYVCKNSGNNEVVTILDPKNIKMTYGDNWICTITNGRPNYVFSGIVFNDNGKITNPTKDDVSDKYLNNPLYFNGKYDSPTESGIPFTTGHTITLNKCTGDTSTSTFTSQTMNINPDGTYSFTLTPAQLGSNTRLCATQNEPNNYTYSVDTTSNVRQINITNNTFNYPDNNFGDVIQDNAALVLFKSQYVHDCSLTDLTTISVNYTGSASTVYSTNPISNIIPGQCIAYRIEAVNRGNVPLTDIIIRDTLQKKGENGALVTSTLATPTPIGENSGVPSFSNSSVSIGNNGQVLTNGFPLGITSSDRRRAIRFNIKYGTTVNP
ncbi:hypothetical protein I3252_11250 [Psychrobacter sp. Ps4]|uniref:hypothetical protein n=1 Tax=Psychrobacter sp. Ps4 TaxID=2790958 RepID=UPI001EE003EF|nr:hypothetical protein [Psychrobacter sp. Ps4]MCG3810054.1 hypothetical protein [Psychrobacter sp. Ps4]